MQLRGPALGYGSLRTRGRGLSRPDFHLIAGIAVWPLISRNASNLYIVIHGKENPARAVPPALVRIDRGASPDTRRLSAVVHRAQSRRTILAAFVLCDERLHPHPHALPPLVGHVLLLVEAVLTIRCPHQSSPSVSSPSDFAHTHAPMTTDTGLRAFRVERQRMLLAKECEAEVESWPQAAPEKGPRCPAAGYRGHEHRVGWQDVRRRTLWHPQMATVC